MLAPDPIRPPVPPAPVPLAPVPSALPFSFPFADLDLSRRLERAEGRTNAWSVEARARRDPASGATWIEADGAWIMFDGVDSPLTQSFGLGLSGPPREMDRIEAFFHERGADAAHEVSPLTGPGMLASLADRGYRPVEGSNVMFRPIGERAPGQAAPGGDAAPPPQVRARAIEPGEEELWARTCAEGWSEFTEYAPLMLELARITAARAGSRVFIAEVEGRAIATGGLSLVDGVALLSGASTIPSARRLGAQRALLEARLRYAVEAGCDLATMVAAPGSASQRNAEREGFRIAYTRIKWVLPHPAKGTKGDAESPPEATP